MLAKLQVENLHYNALIVMGVADGTGRWKKRGKHGVRIATIGSPCIKKKAEE